MSATAIRQAPAETPGNRPRIPRIPGAVLGVGLVGVLAVSVLLAVTIGPAQITFGEAWQSVFAHLGFGDPSLAPLRDGIIWQLRMPRILTAGAVGAGLALCGAVMQSLTRNPLADPYLLGLSSGASLGAVGVILLGVGVLLPVAAFGGAIVALVGTLLLASAGGSLTPTRTILAGLAVSSFFGALTSLVIFWSATGDTYREILSWLLGSLSGAQWSSVAIAAAALVVVGIPLMFSGRVLDAFAFGDTAASALGVSVTRTRWIMLSATALLTGAMVAVSGAIGFIGLILPHMVRLVAGRGNRRVLPLSVITGAIFLIWVDTAARTVFDPRELPVGIFTAAIGAPVFALILLRSRSSS